MQKHLEAKYALIQNVIYLVHDFNPSKCLHEKKIQLPTRFKFEENTNTHINHKHFSATYFQLFDVVGSICLRFAETAQRNASQEKLRPKRWSLVYIEYINSQVSKGQQCSNGAVVCSINYQIISRIPGRGEKSVPFDKKTRVISTKERSWQTRTISNENNFKFIIIFYFTY